MIRISECKHILALEVVLTLSSSIIHPLLSIPCILAIAFTLHFFRDPERKVPSGEVIISPADGRVLEVSVVDDPFVGSAWKVAIFMGPFDVHVNRAPYSGAIKSVVHTPGKKVAAYLAGDLDARERNRIEFDGDLRVSLTQYAGVFARRIVCFKKPQDKVKIGERIGMIKFGSRADVVFQKKFRPAVSKGERVMAGETVVGVLDGKV